MDSSEEDEIHQKEDDAYAEDDLPDLVLDTSRKESFSFDSTSSSVIDLLLSMTKGRRSVSSSDIPTSLADAGDDEIDHFDKEEVKAERTLNDDFKVTYTNHSKNYIPKVSSSDMYRSYLSLMPEEEESTKTQEIHKERLKILAHFQTLTGQQQSEQRETWSEELEIVENEIAELKIKLGVQLNKRNHLRLLLGLDLIKKSVHNLAKEMREFINK